jgi:hypothetical protein
MKKLGTKVKKKKILWKIKGDGMRIRGRIKEKLMDAKPMVC